MSTLNSNAATLAGKYIRQTSPENIVNVRKKRGLQSEINKLESIKKIIINNDIQDKELLRFRIELSKLLDVVTNHINNKI